VITGCDLAQRNKPVRLHPEPNRIGLAERVPLRNRE
jgi:hypothetical protein